MITPLPGATPLNRVHAPCRFPESSPRSWTRPVMTWTKARRHPGHQETVAAMIRTIWGDPERYRKSYYPDEFKGSTTCGRRRQTRLGRLLLDHGPHRRRAQRLGTGWARWKSNRRWSPTYCGGSGGSGQAARHQGEAVVAYVVLKGARPAGDAAKKVAQELRNWVGRNRSDCPSPTKSASATNLPKPLRQDHARLLRAIAKGEEITQDVRLLRNPSILEQLKQST